MHEFYPLRADADEVETEKQPLRRCGQPGIDKKTGSTPHSVLLFFAQRVDPAAEGISGTGLYLRKNEKIALADDQIDFTDSAAAEVPRDDLISLPLVKQLGFPLSGGADRMRTEGIRHSTSVTEIPASFSSSVFVMNSDWSAARLTSTRSRMG